MPEDIEIATGYFAKVKDYANMGYTLVSISLVKPWWIGNKFDIKEFKYLNPTREMIDLAHEGKYAEYETRYREDILCKYKGDNILRELFSRYGKKIVLLCFESSEKFCHRHIVADWIKETTNKEVKEIEVQNG